MIFLKFFHRKLLSALFFYPMANKVVFMLDSCNWGVRLGRHIC